MTITKTFTFTGAAQTYTLPANIVSCTAELWGATGASPLSPGGYVKFNLLASGYTAGQLLNLFVGGLPSAASGTTAGAGGYNGGGRGGNAPSPGSSGGGQTDIRVGGTALSNIVGIAGGGGGAGRGGTGAGGQGGGTVSAGQGSGSGTDGADGTVVGSGGTGGHENFTSAAGGANSTGGTNGGAGSQGAGGNATNNLTSNYRGGGGGGGGWPGGGAGGFHGSAASGCGGGGSNFVISALSESNTYTNLRGTSAPGYSSSVSRAGQIVLTMEIAPDDPTLVSPAAGGAARSDAASTFQVLATSQDPNLFLETVEVYAGRSNVDKSFWSLVGSASLDAPVGVSGTTVPVTVPSGTFLAGKSYGWYAITRYSKTSAAGGGGRTDGIYGYSTTAPTTTQFFADSSHPAAGVSVSSVATNKIPTGPAGGVSASAATAAGNRIENAAGTSRSQASADGAFAPPAIAAATSPSAGAAVGSIGVTGIAAATSASKGEAGAGASWVAAIARSQVGTAYRYTDGSYNFPALYFPGLILTFGGADPANPYGYWQGLSQILVFPADSADAVSTSNAQGSGGGALPLTGIAAVSLSGATVFAPTQGKTAGIAGAVSGSSGTAGALAPTGPAAAATSYSTGAVDSTILGKTGGTASATSGSAATAGATQTKQSVAGAVSNSAVTVSESPFLRGNIAGAVSASMATGDPRHEFEIPAAAAATSSSTATAGNARQTPGVATATSISHADTSVVASSSRTGVASATSASSATAAATKGALGPAISKTGQFTGSIGGTFDAGIGVVALTGATPNDTEDVRLVMTGIARLTVHVPSPPVVDVVRRARLAISFDYQPPVVVGGQPRLPRWGGQIAVGGAALVGGGHIRAFPDPDPVWGGSSWTVEPPAYPEGSNFFRWTAKLLPDPKTYPGKSYPLGAASSVDGTAAITANATRWNAAPGSSLNIPWNSSYPFKPIVQEVVHYGKNGARFVEPIGVHFNAAEIDHMFADFGTYMSAPFTIMACVLVSKYDRRAPWNYIFDSGRDPTAYMSAAQRLDWLQHGPDGPIAIPADALGYRNCLRVSNNQMHAFTDPPPTTRVGKTPYALTYKPQVLGFVVNGASSYCFALGPSTNQRRSMTLANRGAQRLWVMGRGNGVVSPNIASNMVMLEARAWDTPLTVTQVTAHYNQLASTWKFSSYK